MWLHPGDRRETRRAALQADVLSWGDVQRLRVYVRLAASYIAQLVFGSLIVALRNVKTGEPRYRSGLVSHVSLTRRLVPSRWTEHPKRTHSHVIEKLQEADCYQRADYLVG